MGSTKTEKESNTLSGSGISVATLCLQVKKMIGNVTAKKYVKDGLLFIFCFIIQGKGSSWKGFDTEIKFYFVAIAYGNLTQLSFLSSD